MSRVLEDEDPQRHYRRPEAFGMPLGALYDVPRLQDGLLHSEDLVALVPGLLRIEVDAERRGEHGGGEVLGVVTGLLRGLAITVVLGQVAVLLLVGRAREADRGRDEPVRFVGVLPRHHAV